MPGLAISNSLIPLRAGGVSTPTVPLADIDYPINASNKADFWFAYSIEKACYDYTGPTIELTRASPAATQDFTPGSDGRMSKAAILLWVGGSTAKISKAYDITGNGRHHVFTNSPDFVSGGAFVNGSLHTSKSDVNGALSRTGEGALGFPYNGSSTYGETVTCGMDTTGGFELHIMGAFNTRKVGSGFVAADPFSGNATTEIPMSYGTSASNYMHFRVCAGPYLHFSTRYGVAHGGSDVWCYGELSSQKYPQYGVFVNTIACDDSVVARYEYGKKVATGVNTTNATANSNANFGNGTFRSGRGHGTGTNYSNMTVGFMGASKRMTDPASPAGAENEDRVLLHDRLTALARHNRAVSFLDAADPWAEVIDFRDAVSGTGVVAGRKGNMTINLNVGAGNSWEFDYNPTTKATGGNGRRGVRNPSTSNVNNWFEATTNWFYDIQAFTVAAYTHKEQTNIQDVFAFAKTVDANHLATGDSGISLGWDHYGPRAMTGVDSTLDTNSYSDGGFGFNDQTALSQGKCKYDTKMINTEWAPSKLTTGTATLRLNYTINGSASIASGQTITQAELKAGCNIDPPTPEMGYGNTASTGYFLCGAGYYDQTILTLEPHVSYDYAAAQAAREPYLKKAKSKMWCTTGIGSPIGNTDSDMAVCFNSQNHAHMTSDYKLRSSAYQSAYKSMPGTHLVWCFADRVLTDEELERWDTNKYKMYTEGW
jgi:hypothetical protein